MSMFGSSLTGRCRYATAPKMTSAAERTPVITGRWMKGAPGSCAGPDSPIRARRRRWRALPDRHAGTQTRRHPLDDLLAPSFTPLRSPPDHLVPVDAHGRFVARPAITTYK